MQKVPGRKYVPPEEPGGASRPAPGQYGGIRLLAGSASGELGAEIAKHIHTKLSPCEITRFSNENILVKLKNSVRGQDVYLVHSMVSPVSDNIMELLIMLDTLKRDSAG